MYCSERTRDGTGKRLKRTDEMIAFMAKALPIYPFLHISRCASRSAEGAVRSSRTSPLRPERSG